MRRLAAALTGACLLALTAPRGTPAQGLRAAVAKVTTTLDVRAAKVYMAGFGNNRVATGCTDDLYVRCPTLAAGESKLAICAVDLIMFFYDGILKVRDSVKVQAWTRRTLLSLRPASTNDRTR